MPRLKTTQRCASEILTLTGGAQSQEEVAPSRAKPAVCTVAMLFSLRKATEWPAYVSNMYIYGVKISIYNEGRALWAYW